jgi:hypothetical protein
MGRPDVLDLTRPPMRGEHDRTAVAPRTPSPSADTGTPGHNPASASAQFEQSPTTNPQVTALPARSTLESGRRPFLVALLTLDGTVAPGWARANGIEAYSLAEVAAHPVVLAVVAQAVEKANSQLARVQQIKYWRLLPVEWTADSEELTPTLKLKRRVVYAKYADIIDALYAQ